MGKRNLFIGVVLFVLTACGTGERTNENAVFFTRDDFKEHRTLSNPEELVFPNLLNPTAFYLIRDTIVVANNQTNNEYLVEIYSLNNKNTPLAQVARRGNGPGEVLSGAALIHANSPDFMFFDRQANLYYQVNVDSILSNRRLVFDKTIKYSSVLHPNVEPVITGENEYIGYSIWYSDAPKYDNHVPALTRYTPNNVPEERLDVGTLAKYDYFVAPINTVCLFENPSTKQLWMADGHRDRIKIYNDSLCVEKVLCGPDNFKVRYKDVRNNAGIRFVTFDGKESRAYLNYTITDKYIYLIYAGTDSYDIDNLQPVEIFKLDYDGNLLCNYKLDRFVLTLSVDSKEEYFYCTTRKSVQGDEAHFIRYKL